MRVFSTLLLAVAVFSVNTVARTDEYQAAMALRVVKRLSVSSQTATDSIKEALHSHDATSQSSTKDTIDKIHALINNLAGNFEQSIIDMLVHHRFNKRAAAAAPQDQSSTFQADPATSPATGSATLTTSYEVPSPASLTFPNGYPSNYSGPSPTDPPPPSNSSLSVLFSNSTDSGPQPTGPPPGNYSSSSVLFSNSSDAGPQRTGPPAGNSSGSGPPQPTGPLLSNDSSSATPQPSTTPLSDSSSSVASQSTTARTYAKPSVYQSPSKSRGPTSYLYGIPVHAPDPTDDGSPTSSDPPPSGTTDTPVPVQSPASITGGAGDTTSTTAPLTPRGLFPPLPFPLPLPPLPIALPSLLPPLPVALPGILPPVGILPPPPPPTAIPTPTSGPLAGLPAGLPGLPINIPSLPGLPGLPPLPDLPLPISPMAPAVAQGLIPMITNTSTVLHEIAQSLGLGPFEEGFKRVTSGLSGAILVLELIVNGILTAATLLVDGVVVVAGVLIDSLMTGLALLVSGALGGLDGNSTQGIGNGTTSSSMVDTSSMMDTSTADQYFTIQTIGDVPTTLVTATAAAKRH